VRNSQDRYSENAHVYTDLAAISPVGKAKSLGREVGVPSLWPRPGGVLQQHGLGVIRQLNRALPNLMRWSAGREDKPINATNGTGNPTRVAQHGVASVRGVPNGTTSYTRSTVI
jgi:hypothetical protein